MIGPPRTERGSGLGPHHNLLGQFVIRLRIEMGAVVEAHHVHDGREMGVDSILHPVDPHGNEARRVLPMTDILQPPGDLRPFVTALVGNLVADAPHHHRRMIAETPDRIDQIALGPFVEIEVITVLHLGGAPLVEGLHHHHQPHPVAQFDQLRSGDIMRRADGIGPHLLEDRQLPAQRTDVDRRAQRPEIVMQANTPELDRFAVEEHPPVGNDFQLPDTERHRTGIPKLPVGI